MPKTDVHHTSTPTGGLWGPLKPACSLPPPRARTLCRQAGIYYAKTVARVGASCFWGDCARVRPGFLCWGLCSHLSRESACGGAWPRDWGGRDVQVLICLSVLQKFHATAWRKEPWATCTAKEPAAILRGDGVRNECSVFTRAKTHTGLFNVPCLAREM